MSARSQHVRFCTSRDGTRIAFATRGSGPPLVRAAHWLSHLNHETQCPLWGPWLSLLSRRHTLIRYDGRGCGLSDREVDDFSLDRCVEDLEAVVESCKIGRFVLVGATIGGMTALAYAARHPERVSHLVIIGALAVGRMARDPPEQVEEAGLELKAIELGWRNDNPAFRQFFTSQFIPNSTPEQARSLNELLRLATTPETAIRRLRPFHQVDLREIATRIQCPTLVVPLARRRAHPVRAGARPGGAHSGRAVRGARQPQSLGGRYRARLGAIRRRARRLPAGPAAGARPRRGCGPARR